MELLKKLSDTKEKNIETVQNLQLKIDNLTNRLLTISTEKDSLKNELAILSDQFENMPSPTPIFTDEEHTVSEYKEKIKSLMTENIELSTNLMDKIEELEKVKESKVQLYDHHCSFKETSEILVQKLEYLEMKNNESSRDLIQSKEECDELKKTLDVLKIQLETYASQQISENSSTDNLEFIEKNNTQVTCKIIELEEKLSQLIKENTDLSRKVLLENVNKQNESVVISDRSSNISVLKLEESVHENISDETNNFLLTNKKIKPFQKENELLISSNKNLGDLKLMNCSQCSQLKLESQSLNKKIADLERKFQQQCTDTESLRAKANENFNTSLNLMDSTLNSSGYDGMNLTLIEEKIENLRYELLESKENNKLFNNLKEKNNELEKLQLSTNSFASPSHVKEIRRSDVNTSCKKSRMQTFKKNLDRLSNDIKEIKQSSNNHANILNKLKKVQNDTLLELESLKLLNEELQKERDIAKDSVLNYEEKINLLEEELATLYKRIETDDLEEKNIKAQKLEIEIKFESLLKEKEELVNSLHNVEETFRKEKEDHNTFVDKYEKENLNLMNELQKFKDTVQELEKKDGRYSEEKLQEEIKTAKSRIINELVDLTSLSENELKEVLNMTVTDIFLRFLNVIMLKEKEMVNNLYENFEKNRRKLEEEKQQSLDSEKRIMTWVKNLESDLHKTEEDLINEKNKNERLEDKLKKLNEGLRETEHENQRLQLNITNLEKEFNSLHNELEKKSKMNDDRDYAINAVQEKERIARNKEEELEARLQYEKEEYQSKLKELESQLNSYKSTNDDLKSTIEGLDIQIEHLKNTINIKANELITSENKIKTMIQEIMDFEEINQQLKVENFEKNKQIKEITNLLKMKCDLLTEFKTKVETMKPEYESLQSQIEERKLSIEKYKEEIHNLKLDNKKQIDILQDKLSAEEIKSKGLNKQLNDFKNTNTTLHTTLEEYKNQCWELERANERLNKKVFFLFFFLFRFYKINKFSHK
jgi:chromosome segregation ATPase